MEVEMVNREQLEAAHEKDKEAQKEHEAKHFANSKDEIEAGEKALQILTDAGCKASLFLYVRSDKGVRVALMKDNIIETIGGEENFVDGLESHPQTYLMYAVHAIMNVASSIIGSNHFDNLIEYVKRMAQHAQKTIDQETGDSENGPKI